MLSLLVDRFILVRQLFVQHNQQVDKANTQVAYINSIDANEKITSKLLAYLDMSTGLPYALNTVKQTGRLWYLN